MKCRVVIPMVVCLVLAWAAEVPAQSLAFAERTGQVGLDVSHTPPPPPVDEESTGNVMLGGAGVALDLALKLTLSRPCGRVLRGALDWERLNA